MGKMRHNAKDTLAAMHHWLYRNSTEWQYNGAALERLGNLHSLMKRVHT